VNLVKLIAYAQMGFIKDLVKPGVSKRMIGNWVRASYIYNT
jgi:hypothetical protein